MANQGSQILTKGQLVCADCRRCNLPFRYICKGGRRRMFCEPCRELEQQDSNALFNAVAKQRRAEQRRLAHTIHPEAQHEAS